MRKNKYMNPKFEQNKKMEAELEKTLSIKPESHLVLNDVALKLMTQEDLTQKDTDFLESVWSELQVLDSGIVDFIDYHRSEGRVGREESLVVASFFLMSLQVGPDARATRNDFYDLELDPRAFGDLSKNVSVPEHTRNVIISVYTQLYNAKKVG